MYYLYVDESGDAGDFTDKEGKIIEGSSKYFTLAGIIVNDIVQMEFEEELDQLINETFEGIALPDNFKLHYHPLRQKKYPYNQISDEQRYEIPNRIFKWIQNADCKLISITIDLEKHCKYPRPADPRAYSLLLMLERFQYFLEDEWDQGIAFYEKFNAKMRKKVENELKWLQNIPTFPTPTSLYLLDGKVRNGDPAKETILQISDFFAYAPWIKKMTDGDSVSRFYSIVFKYYNIGAPKSRSGFVEL